MLCQLNISNRFKSENFDIRKKKVSFIIFHYTETKNLEDAIKLLTNKKRKVSCHYVIDYNGSIYNLVDIKKRAWHAGESSWENLMDINSRSIGIEIVNPGEKKKIKYKVKQINSLIELTKLLKKKFKISDSRILGHSDIAPQRKIDPGIYFPWKKLNENDIGLWVKDKYDKSKLTEKDFLFFLDNLKKFGYPYITNNLKSKNKQIIESFHRHHLPKMVGKRLSKSSLLKSIDLLKIKNS